MKKKTKKRRKKLKNQASLKEIKGTRKKEVSSAKNQKIFISSNGSCKQTFIPV